MLIADGITTPAGTLAVQARVAGLAKVVVWSLSTVRERLLFLQQSLGLASRRAFAQ